MLAARYAGAAALVLALAGCSSDGREAERAPGPSPTASSSPSAPQATASSSSPASPAHDELDWEPVDGPVRDSVTTDGPWTLTVENNGGTWSLDGPRDESGGPTSGFRVSDALMDADWAVVVLQDRTEQQPSRAQVTDLRTGKMFTIDGTSDVPTTNGGTWALGQGRLLHATVSKGSYCVAEVDLATRQSQVGWCAPGRTGFNGAHITPAGASVLSFDSGRPSCRTLLSLEDTAGTPFPGVPDCTAWDGLLTDDGAVWSVIPNEHRIEQAHFYARSADGEADLGPGTAGTLVWCGDAAWFVRDPQQEGDPAALMRWTAAEGLTVAYESPGGRAFLSAPRCGGQAITVTAMAEQGDEQVTAVLS
ncbi:hypothetical protein [Nocardioides sp. URHA0032]|uniref:hypothetical protein n=1 Tax=Nocardioides sp. URHA0032 TaxID=1380388 RepID=UPI00048D4C94|nr:hypothetical protein [Nocardioides sp. URHA0032]